MTSPHRCWALALALLLPLPSGVSAQVDGSIGHTLAGAGLGAYSGATLGLLGGLFPCNRTADGRRCVVSVASTGGALGIAMGGFIGSQNVDALDTRFEGAGIGAGAGALLGLGVAALVDQYGWLDVGSMALIGGAVGASPYGSAVGAGTGLLGGAIAWALVPEAGVQDVVLYTLAGMAIGGMLDWADGAADRQRTGYSISFSVAAR